MISKIRNKILLHRIQSVTSTAAFVYQNSIKVVIRQRFAAAWTAIGKLRTIFHSAAPEVMKIKLFKSAVKTIDVYALESCLLNSMMSYMLNAGQRQMIRAALGINWQNNITNEEEYAKSGLQPFSQTIRKRRLCLNGQSLHLQSRSTTPLGLMPQILNIVFPVRCGQG